MTTDARGRGGTNADHPDADAIRRETFIAAPLERVWAMICRAGFWVGDDVHFETAAAEGETVTIDAGRHGRFPVRVERLDPPGYAAYRWASGFPDAAITPDNSTLVEFVLVERDGGVLLRVTESGFAGLAGTVEFRAGRRADNEGGWTAQLARLAAVAEGAAQAAGGNPAP